MNKDTILYSITVEDVQDLAIMTIDRELTDDELEVAGEALAWGFDLTQHEIIDSILEMAETIKQREADHEKRPIH